MEVLKAFVVGLIFSFLGSIPPGSLNICVLQLGIDGKRKTAMRFALAVAIIEYPYTWIAIRFQDLITASPMVIQNFQLISAIVMSVLGIMTLWSAKSPHSLPAQFRDSGFRRGLILSILNPMAIPFWIGVTAYLVAQKWITINTPFREHSYILGTSAGVMILLTLFTFLAGKLGAALQQSKYIKILPGVMLLCLGLYAFARYFFFAS